MHPTEAEYREMDRLRFPFMFAEKLEGELVHNAYKLKGGKLTAAERRIIKKLATILGEKGVIRRSDWDGISGGNRFRADLYEINISEGVNHGCES